MTHHNADELAGRLAKAYCHSDGFIYGLALTNADRKLIIEALRSPKPQEQLAAELQHHADRITEGAASEGCINAAFWMREASRLLCHPQQPQGVVGERKFKSDFGAEIYKAMERLGASPDLLSIIGSYGDTLDDAEVLSILKHYNEIGIVIYDTH